MKEMVNPITLGTLHFGDSEGPAFYLYSISPQQVNKLITKKSSYRNRRGRVALFGKMFCLHRKVFLNVKQKILIPTPPVRFFWEYVNMMFNKPDPERIKSLGPDRACAEWVLRNGGKVVWANGKTLDDYNLLPPESQCVPKIVEIDGTDSSISHYGFSHLSGCTKLEKIILHNNKYIDDRAMKGLSYGLATLSHVQVSECINVRDQGLKEIKVLKNLQTLILFSLSSVSDLEECKKYLQSQLPKCKILGKEEDKIST